MEDPLRQALLLFALQNAVKHQSIPKAGTVIGMVMGKYPEMKPRAKEATALVKEVIEEVSALSPDERAQCLESMAPELVEEMSRPREQVRVLPALEKAEKGVVMRFAPNPSGPLHLGHARAAVLNDAYVLRYGGRYVLRIEDTDPKRVDPLAYDMVREDIEWLGLAISDIVYQSDRFDLYYRYGRELIERGGAYVCTCDNERFREMKLARKACPCRGRSIEEDLAAFEKMRAGEYEEGDATLRVRTDLDHPDPAMRDYPAFRILKSPPHPRMDAFLYPLMNFSVAVDDHLLGITHVIRGKDHIANTRRQRYIFDYFGWEPPVYRHYGRMGIEGVVLSTSQMRAGIAAGEYQGWDDIRIGTLRAIARRGITPEAVREAVLDIGIGETDISFSWENLFARNKAVVDPVANRYFFVPDPVLVRVKGAPDHVAHALLHPAHPERGTRDLHFTGQILLPREDMEKGRVMIRLKDLFNIEISGEGEDISARFAGESLAEARAQKAPIIQWLPEGTGIPCTLVTPNGNRTGICEPGVAREKGAVVQFERVGFARIDAVTPEGIIAYFTHR
ncbi:MAG: Glutamate--tRNA ligase [Methanoregulaceae archaeon PtaB.Bin056]|jgi:glutamyl-tRNA synthetase|nr:MAG: Glutamate--tRNA ligase [Methanoregulaceae archaeon PtaB.Bin056]